MQTTARSPFETNTQGVLAARVSIVLLVISLASCVFLKTDLTATHTIINRDITTKQPPVALPTSVALLPFLNTSGHRFDSGLVRRTLYNHLAAKNYRMLRWQDIDLVLSQAGISSDAMLQRQQPAELAALLGVDSLIYGDVINYHKPPNSIDGPITIDMTLSFVMADGSLIWQATHTQASDIKSPAFTNAHSLLNLGPGDRQSQVDMRLHRVANYAGLILASKLPEPSRFNPQAKPKVHGLAHSGVGQTLRHGDKIHIAMTGDPDMVATALIDGRVIHLTETEAGEYTGYLNIDADDSVANEVLIGNLLDRRAQTSQWIAPFGLINIDNSAPAPITKLTAKPEDRSVRLDWQASSEADVMGYMITQTKTPSGPALRTLKSSINNLLIDDLKNYETYYYSVRAEDRAGNLSPPTSLTIAAAPDDRFTNAIKMASEIPAIIHGVYRMHPGANPYVLRHASLIATDGIVLIEPGVEIRVAPTGRLTVLGELHSFGNAFGANQNMIRVSSLNNQDFNEFLVLQSRQPIRLSGLNIEGAGIPIQINAGSPLITFSRLVNAKFNCLTIGGSSMPKIKHNLLAGAGTTCILISGQSKPKLEHNQFVDNQPVHIRNDSTYEISAEQNQWQPVASKSSILGRVRY